MDMPTDANNHEAEPVTDTPTIDWPAERIAELLGQITLTQGHHSDGAQACAMDLIGMAIDGEWTDTPSCVHPVLARAVHRINDHHDTTTEERLALVLDAGPLLIGTNDKSRTPWAVMVAYRAGRTAPGLIAALATTPDRADLSWADLSGAALYGADLYGADLYGADLSRADLSGADLSGADLLDEAHNVPAEVLAAWKAAQ